MMEAELFKELGKIAGIGGISVGVFLILFREVIRKKIFPRLDRDKAYRLLRLVLVLTWMVAILGIGAWTFISHSNSNTKPAALSPQVFDSSLTLSLSVGNESAPTSHIIIRANAEDYELGWYKGIIRFTGYFVIHENIEMHMGRVFTLKAVSAEDVLLKYQGVGNDPIQAKLPRFEEDVGDNDALERFEGFLFKKRGQLVFIKSEFSESHASF